MNAREAALPDRKLIQPTKARRIDQLRTLFALEAMCSIRTGEFSTKVEPTATTTPRMKTVGKPVLGAAPFWSLKTNSTN